MKALLQKSISDVKSDLIDALIEVHNQAQSWQTKRQILHFAYHSFSVCLRGGGELGASGIDWSITVKVVSTLFIGGPEFVPISLNSFTLVQVRQ